MIEQTAKVLRVEQDVAWLQVQRESTCGQCTMNKGCGTHSLARILGKRSSEVRALNQLQLQPGDLVTIALRESTLLKSAFLMYFFPLVAMFSGALVGDWLSQLLQTGNTQLWIVCFALIAFAGSMLFIRHVMSKQAHNEHFQPVIVRKHIASVTVL